MTDLTAVSLFDGIGGIHLALKRAGVRVVAGVEIDPACRGVLARHFPGAVLFNDVTEVTGDQLRAAGFVPGRGILAGGWPCTGNSVAGRREGMADPRSGLWVQFARLLAELRPRWFLGENVPGLYSVNDGRDIAIVRRDLAQLGYWWAERTLDAQHFGVPQRRRRVFFAGCLGDRARPVQVLFDPDCGDGDSAPGRQAGTSAARSAANGTGSPRTVGTLGGNGPGGGWRVGADEAATGQLVAATLQGGGRRGHRIDAEGAAGGHLIAHTLTGEGFDASEDGTGRGIPIVPTGMPPVTIMAVSENQRGEAAGRRPTPARSTQAAGNPARVIRQCAKEWQYGA